MHALSRNRSVLTPMRFLLLPKASLLSVDLRCLGAYSIVITACFIVCISAQPSSRWNICWYFTHPYEQSSCNPRPLDAASDMLGDLLVYAGMVRVYDCNISDCNISVCHWLPLYVYFRVQLESTAYPPTPMNNRDAVFSQMAEGQVTQQLYIYIYATRDEDPRLTAIPALYIACMHVSIFQFKLH